MSGPSWDVLEEPPANPPLLAELWSRARPVELLVLGAVPAVLLGVFAAFDGAPDGLVLSYVEPTTVSVVSAHFVHRSATHLVANLAAYGFVVPTGYVLAVLSGRGREYLLAFVGLLVVLPPVLSGLILLAFERGVAFGFSGVTMALVGLLPVFLGGFVEGRIGGVPPTGVGPGLFFLGLGFVAARSLPATAYRPVLVALPAAVALLYLRSALRAVPPAGGAVASLRSPDAQLAVVGLGAFVLGLVAGFPVGPQRGAVVVNVYGHLLGFGIGFVVPYAAFRVLGPTHTAEEDERGVV